MRRLPIYSIFQDLIMQLIMLLLVVAYIFYDFAAILGWVSYAIIALAVILSVLASIFMIKNTIVVKVYQSVQLSFSKNIFINSYYFAISNLIVIAATAAHFYLRYSFHFDLTDLYWEYGFGGLIAIGLQLLLKRNPVLSITDKGLIVGSKFEMKVVEWKQINALTNEDNSFTIHFKSVFPLKKIKVPKNSKTIDFKKFIEHNTTAN